MSTVTTNNIPRLIVDAYELTPKEREEFDYLDWDAIDKGENGAEFFRYKGQLYDLNEFQVVPKHAGVYPYGKYQDWDGYQSDSFFSGLLIRYAEDDAVVVGRYHE